MLGRFVRVAEDHAVVEVAVRDLAGCALIEAGVAANPDRRLGDHEHVQQPHAKRRDGDGP